jgi:hypothetical protein
MFIARKKARDEIMAPVFRVKEICSDEDQKNYEEKLIEYGYHAKRHAFSIVHCISIPIVDRISDAEEEWVLFNCLINWVIMSGLGLLTMLLALNLP